MTGIARRIAAASGGHIYSPRALPQKDHIERLGQNAIKMAA